MIVKKTIQNNPPIDIGFGIHDNFTVYKISLVFVDALIDIKSSSVLFGVGLPLYKAFVIYIKF